MKHDNVIIYNMFMWNWAKLTLCDDMLFIASCINNALTDENHWPTQHKKVVLARPNFSHDLNNHYFLVDMSRPQLKSNNLNSIANAKTIKNNPI
jgi:hypothetical protein